jgi:single-strand DNA-binding protein
MGFRSDAFAKVWKTENKGNYSIVELSTSKKNKETGKYDTDFSSKFVRFIGTAHKMAETLQDGASIKLGNVEVTNSYDKEKKIGYTNFLVFSFEIPDGNGSNANSKPAPSQAKNNGFMNIPDGIDEELPFN